VAVDDASVPEILHRDPPISDRRDLVERQQGVLSAAAQLFGSADGVHDAAGGFARQQIERDMEHVCGGPAAGKSPPRQELQLGGLPDLPRTTHHVHRGLCQGDAIGDERGQLDRLGGQTAQVRVVTLPGVGLRPPRVLFDQQCIGKSHAISRRYHLFSGNQQPQTDD